MAANAYGLRLLTQPRVQRAVLFLLVAIVLVYRAIQFLMLSGRIQWGYDFSAYWAAAERLNSGGSLYTAAQLAGPYAPQAQFLYLYPPPLAGLLRPIAALLPIDYRAAAWGWAVLGAAIVVVAVLALWRTERLGERFELLRGGGRWLLVAAAFAFPPLVGELVLGNVHILLLGLLTLAWIGLRRRDERGQWVAGVAVGIAAAIKVLPALLLVWFLVTRRYRAAGGVLVGAAAMSLLSLPLTGTQPWLDFPTVLANLSAPSDTTDTLAPTVWLGDLVGFTEARVLVTLAGLAILVVTAARRTHEAASFAIAVVIAILVAPAVYHHYLALLVLPFVLALSAGVPIRWLALGYFLMWGGQQNAAGELAWIVNKGLPTLGALVLLGALVAQVTRSAPATRPTFTPA